MDFSKIFDTIWNVQLSDKISFIALIVAIISLYKTWRTNKNIENIPAPVISGRYTQGKQYVFHIEDYSASKNLRIINVKIRQDGKWKYFNAIYTENRLPEQVPPVVQVILPDEIIFDRFNI